MVKPQKPTPCNWVIIGEVILSKLNFLCHNLRKLGNCVELNKYACKYINNIYYVYRYWISNSNQMVSKVILKCSSDILSNEKQFIQIAITKLVFQMHLMIGTHLSGRNTRKVKKDT